MLICFLRWLLKTMMLLQKIDIQELNTGLGYWEAKVEIQRALIFHIIRFMSEGLLIQVSDDDLTF